MASLGRFGKIKFHVNLAFLFTSLILFAFAILISFTYFRTLNAIIEDAKLAIDRAGSVISERVNCQVVGVEGLSATTIGLIPSASLVTIENKDLVSYLFSAVKNNPLIYGHYIGTNKGSFLQVVNIQIAGRNTYISDPKKTLPPDAVFGLRYLNRSVEPPEETWYYKNVNQETVAEEKIPTVTYDPRKRPWYIGAEKMKKLSWTGIYQYNSLSGSGAQASGISTGDPVYNKAGELEAVIGTDVTLSTLSSFISEQKIAKTGKAVILDKKGAIIVPFASDLKNYPQWFSTEIVSLPFKSYVDKAEKTLKYTYKNEVFLSDVIEFPISGGDNWLILFVAPLDEFLYSLIQTQKEVLAISFVILICSLLFVYWISKRTTKPIVILSDEVSKIRHFQLDSNVRVKSNIREIYLLDESIASMRATINSFASYVPREIVKRMIENGVPIGLGGTRKELTILFTDIEKFTSIIEKLPTEPVMVMLAEYFDQLSKIILNHEGTIDKFIGDSIMAFWGDPVEVIDSCTKACISVLLCQAYLRIFNEQQKDAGKPPFNTRFGLDHGSVITGNVGTELRMNYTVIGDAVNIAARLESLSKEYGTNILISENVAKRINDQFHIRPIDYLAVKGKTMQINVYELLGLKEGDSRIITSQAGIELAELFTAAYEAFHHNEFDRARSIFKILKEKYPNDIPTKIYLERIEVLSKN